MSRRPDGYTVVPFPRLRRVVLDAGYLAARKYTTHGLVEIDVTEPRRLIREQAARAGEALSFTAFLVACLARAVSEDRLVQASRTWRNQLIVFDDVDVATLVEVEAGRDRVPLVRVIRRADKRTVRESTSTSPSVSTTTSWTGRRRRASSSGSSTWSRAGTG